MDFLTILGIPILTTALWLYTIGIARTRFPRITNKRVGLLIAHPDDEAMFFAPTLLALTEESSGNHVKILCLSSGDADGLGETRKNELVHSSMILGLRSQADVTIVESDDFQDSMTKVWNPTAISNVITRAFLEPIIDGARGEKIYAPGIDILITFDSHGVSSHPNHISLHAGTREFISTRKSSFPKAKKSASLQNNDIALYTLTSLPIYRKYISIFDSLPSITSIVFRGRAKEDENPRSLLFMSGPREMERAREAMWKAHKSQMRWFRWGWIWLSRYMAVNDLVLEEVK